MSLENKSTIRWPLESNSLRRNKYGIAREREEDTIYQARGMRIDHR
jgi:hypothetical protein